MRNTPVEPSNESIAITLARLRGRLGLVDWKITFLESLQHIPERPKARPSLLRYSSSRVVKRTKLL